MGSSKDRPAGMDNLKFNQPMPTEKTPPSKSEMAAVVKVAAGPVDSSTSGMHMKVLSGDKK